MLVATYGSPITNLSPAFTEGTTPREPTRAAAASLASVKPGQCAVWEFDGIDSYARKDVSIEIWCDHYIINPGCTS